MSHTIVHTVTDKQTAHEWLDGLLFDVERTEFVLCPNCYFSWSQFKPSSPPGIRASSCRLLRCWGIAMFWEVDTNNPRLLELKETAYRFKWR